MAFPFQSQLFKGDHGLEPCAANDRDHIKKSASGEHVDKIQQALIRIAQDEPDLKAKVRIARAEINSKTYGTTAEAAVLAYKTKRKIINRAYQTAPDNIVGKMTISKLDDEIAIKEGHAPSGTFIFRPCFLEYELRPLTRAEPSLLYQRGATQSILNSPVSSFTV